MISSNFQSISGQNRSSLFIVEREFSRSLIQLLRDNRQMNWIGIGNAYCQCHYQLQSLELNLSGPTMPHDDDALNLCRASCCVLLMGNPSSNHWALLSLSSSWIGIGNEAFSKEICTLPEIRRVFNQFSCNSIPGASLSQCHVRIQLTSNNNLSTF